VKNINIVKLKVKQLKLLKESPIEKSNIEEGLYALGFKIGFYYVEHL